MSNPFTKIADGIADAIGDVVDAVGDIGKGIEESVEQTISKPLPGVSTEEQDGEGFFDPLVPAQHSGFKTRKGAQLTPVELAAFEQNRIIYSQLFFPGLSLIDTGEIQTVSYKWCWFYISTANSNPVTNQIRLTVRFLDPLSNTFNENIFVTDAGIPANHTRTFHFTAGETRYLGRGPMQRPNGGSLGSSRYLGHVPMMPSRVQILLGSTVITSNTTRIVGVGDVL